MKKFFLLFFIVISLIIGGFILNNHIKKEHYVDVQKQRVELFLQTNLVGFNLKKITITKTSQSPLGGNKIEGYINSDKSLTFEATMYGNSNYQFDGEMSTTGKLDKYLFTKDKPTSMDEIFKEKHLNKHDYEADPPFFF